MERRLLHGRLRRAVRSCGQLLSDAPGFVNAMNYGLRRGYAAATMDGGRWGTPARPTRAGRSITASPRLTALESWLETGEAPDALETTRYDADGEPLWSRPACAWPARETWDGVGDWRSADSFTCE